MRNALGSYQRVVLLGGTSAIAVATVSRWAATSPGLEVVLAARPSNKRDGVAAELAARGARVEAVDLDVEADPAVQQETMAAVCPMMSMSSSWRSVCWGIRNRPGRTLTPPCE